MPAFEPQIDGSVICSWRTKAKGLSAGRRGWKSVDGDSLVCADEPCLALLSDATNHTLGVRRQRADDHWHPVFDDPGFFAGNFRDRCAEILLVIERNRGDGRHH